MDPRDLSDDDLDQLAQQLAGRLPTGTHGDRVVLSRRQFAAAASGVLSAGALTALGVDEASAQAAGQVGTSSDPVDAFAYDLNVANQVTSSLPMNGNNIENAGSVSTIGPAQRIISDDTDSEVSLPAGASATLSIPSFFTGSNVSTGGILLISVEHAANNNLKISRGFQIQKRDGEGFQSEALSQTLSTRFDATIDSVDIDDQGDLSITISSQSSFDRQIIGESHYAGT